MSGHSRWAGIKHKKAIIDSKRGKIFTRIGREISVAAKEGGGNPENNARLRKAMDDAREVNMPQENIKRAIQRGTGEIPGVSFEEVRYEGYGPQGVAILVEATTDNKNRTTAEIRKIFSEHGGNIAEAGAVAWMFSLKGYIAVEKKVVSEESLLSLALDSGAEDMKSSDEDYYEIFTMPQDFQKVKDALESKKISVTNQELTQISQTSITVSGEEAQKLLSLIQELEEHEDVKSVFSNFDIPKEILLKMSV
ncbi:MAG: YebC/PmpR family DNA-binding transcriptional regulator [Elusimicrobia bacterium]|nr:YebC/PmpR family DNA-binding transcriptional regulator [Elusimicrobiota bacterium]